MLNSFQIDFTSKPQFWRKLHPAEKVDKLHFYQSWKYQDICYLGLKFVIQTCHEWERNHNIFIQPLHMFLIIYLEKFDVDIPIFSTLSYSEKF